MPGLFLFCFVFCCLLRAEGSDDLHGMREEGEWMREPSRRRAPPEDKQLLACQPLEDQLLGINSLATEWEVGLYLR